MMNIQEDIEDLANRYAPTIKQRELLLKLLFYRLFVQIGPQTYEATTLRDFIQDAEADSIKPTYGLSPLKWPFLGEAIIYINSPLRFNFKDKTTGIVSDINDSLEVILDRPFIERQIRQNKLVDQMTLHEVSLVYKVKDKKTYLSRYSSHGPPHGAFNFLRQQV